ncbi:MAG: hypothetical protein EOM59_05095 [Clostridia bacterium]|nr:hypothetical protein [Clostridia bacterium]
MSLFGKKKEKDTTSQPIAPAASSPGSDLDPSDPMYLIKKAKAMGLDLSGLAKELEDKKMTVVTTYEKLEQSKLDTCVAELKPLGLGTPNEARAMLFTISMLLTDNAYAAPTTYMKMEDTTPQLWKSYLGLVNNLATMDLGTYYSIKDEEKIKKIVQLAVNSQHYPIYE